MVSPDPNTASDEEPRTATSTGRWWRRTLLETVLILGAVVLAEALVSSRGIGSPGAHPHPYWLVVIPMAAGRGLVAGLVASVLASAMVVTGVLRADPTLTARDLLSVQILLDPLLFAAASFLIGEFHDAKAERDAERQRDMESLHDALSRVRRERDVLARANRQVESRLVDHAVAFGNMIVAAARIDMAGREEVFRVALEMVEEQCGATASVLLLLPGGSLEVKCSRGWAEGDDALRLTAARKSAVVQRAIASGAPVNGFAWDEDLPEDGPIVVRPLADSEHVVHALFCLDDVPETRLNQTTVGTFFAIGEWMEVALRRHGGFDGTLEPITTAPLHVGAPLVGTPEDLAERLRVEVGRHIRHGVEVCILAVQFTGAEPIEQITGTRAEHLVRHLLAARRSSDAIFAFGFRHCYAVVLAGTSEAGGAIVAERVGRRALRLPASVVDSLRVDVICPDPEEPSPVEVLDRLAGLFHERSGIPLSASLSLPPVPMRTLQSVEQFVHRLAHEVTLAVRHEHELHVLSVRFVREFEGGELLAPRFERVLDRLRETDGAYSVGPDHCAVILPATTAPEAESVEQKLREHLADGDSEGWTNNLRMHAIRMDQRCPDGVALIEELGRVAPLRGAPLAEAVA